jgi:hypothetical protein
MRHRFVPSYYARDLLNKLQRLKQGTHTVEEYYQELQTGMLCCGLVENNDTAMAHFLGGLNREIQDVLDYKEYTNITRLFHLACNSFAGHTTSFHSDPKPVVASPPAAPSPPSSTPHDKAVAKNLAPLPAIKGASFSGRTKDIQCHHCKGFGHVIQDCPNKCTLIIRDNGEYSSASDSEETIYALLATNVAGTQEEHVDATDADKYESLVVQRVLSTQVAQPEQHQRHTCSIPKALCKNAPFASLLMVAAATTWQPRRWWRSCLFPRGHTQTPTIFNGLTRAVNSR